MNLKRTFRNTAPATLLVLATACSTTPAPRVVATAPTAPRPTPPTKPVLPAVPAQKYSYDNIDAYKVDVAEHIIRTNPRRTFTHALPPMLPAIVVVNISVDKEGVVTKAAVQRSRDGEASAVALAAIKQSGPLPKPMNLLAGKRGPLEFSETFLFNKEYQFKLRSTAGPQDLNATL
jgi:protein TonB